VRRDARPAARHPRASRGGGLSSPALVERDILADPALLEAFGSTIPLLELDGRRLELAIGAGTIRRFLADALDGEAATVLR
jgi:hypothetical protein